MPDNSASNDPLVIHIPASSPLVSYSPSIVAADASSGWKVTNETLSEGFSARLDSDDEGWLMLEDVHGSNLTPILRASDWSRVDVKVQIDSNPVTTISQSGQVSSLGADDCAHTVKLQAKGGVGLAGFDVRAASGSPLAEMTLDDGSSLISYQGFSRGAAVDGSPPLVPGDVVAAGLNGTLSYTATAGATASVDFTGTAIQLLGAVGPRLVTYTLQLDDATPVHYNASAPVWAAKQVLGLWTGLEQGEHRLVVTSGDGEDGHGGLAIDALVAWGNGRACFGSQCVTGSPAATSSTATASSTTMTTTTAAPSTPAAAPAGEAVSGPSAGSIVGGLLGGLAGLFLLLFLLRRLRQRHIKSVEAARKKELSPWDKANLLETRSHALPMVQVRPETEMPYYYRESFESRLKVVADDAIPLPLIHLPACAMLLSIDVVVR